MTWAMIYIIMMEVHKIKLCTVKVRSQNRRGGEGDQRLRAPDALAEDQVWWQATTFVSQLPVTPVLGISESTA